MSNLLTNAEKRKIYLLETLARRTDWLPLSTISKKLKTSRRTLLEDLDLINQLANDYVVETSNQGIRLVFHKGKNSESIYRDTLIHSKAYQLLEAVFLYEGQSVGDIAEKLEVSSQTIYRLVNQMNEDLAEHDFEIQTSPCAVVGNERNIRFFYYTYFNEKYTHFNWMYTNEELALLDEFVLFLVNQTEVSNNFSFFNSLKLVVIVNLIRYQHQHFIDSTNIKVNAEELMEQLDFGLDLFNQFHTVFKVPVTRTLFLELFDHYLQEGFTINYERLRMKVDTDEHVAHCHESISTILDELSAKSQIPLVDKEAIILGLHNAAHLEYLGPQSGYIFFNRNKLFVDRIEENFPNFHGLALEAMKKFRVALNKPLTEDGLNYFIYILFITWTGLISALLNNRDPVRVLVISDRHTLHAQMIKNFIEFEFSEKIQVEIYKEMTFNQKALAASTFDLIITNFPISKIENKEAVYIENVPSLNDLKKVQHSINNILTS